MATTWATAKCAACGTPAAALVPAAPGARWIACPSCHRPVPLVPPTNPPPLFTWEVFPQVYPPLPPLRVPSASLRRLAAVALAACAILLVGVAGALIYGGAQALGPASFRLTGVVVDPAGTPLAGANVTLAPEAAGIAHATTGPGGTFSFASIPPGGATLNVSAPGRTSVTLDLFFSPTYTATGAGPAGLTVTLAPGSGGTSTVVYESPFGNLEAFVSSLWSTGVLLLLAAFLAGVAAVSAARGRGGPLGVAAGLGSAISPIALTVLGVAVAYPLTELPAAALVGLGVAAAFLELFPIVWSAPAPDLE